MRIFVKFQFEGIHQWPDAVKYPGVEFLANPHRHMFYVRVDISVSHDDRELEFILVKRELSGLFKDIEQCNNKSCEMIANDILNYMATKRKYIQRNVIVEVSEDNENGAVATRYL